MRLRNSSRGVLRSSFSRTIILKCLCDTEDNSRRGTVREPKLLTWLNWDPGNTSHFHWAKSGAYVTQVTAIGPLGLEYMDPDDDPRNRE
jgi:hypothetical protein